MAANKHAYTRVRFNWGVVRAPITQGAHGASPLEINFRLADWQCSSDMPRWREWRAPHALWYYSRGGKSQRREEKRREEDQRRERREEEEDQRRERVRRKKMQVREKVEKSRFTVFFQWFVAPEGRKVGSLKRRVRSHLARWEMKNCTPLWREAHFEVKMHKTRQLRSTFRNWDVEKVHAVVARSTFRSQNVQSTSARSHFGIEMSKKCTPLWCEAHFEVKMYKTHQLSDHFWKLRCWKSARRCGAKHISKSKA